MSASRDTEILVLCGLHAPYLPGEMVNEQAVWVLLSLGVAGTVHTLPTSLSKYCLVQAHKPG